VKTDVLYMKTDVLYMKTDVLYVKTDVLYMKTDVLYMKTDVLYMKTDVLCISLNSFLGCEMFQTKVVQKIKTHLCAMTYLPENRAFYEIMRKKDMVEPDVPRMTIPGMAHVLCIPDN